MNEIPDDFGPEKAALHRLLIFIAKTALEQIDREGVAISDAPADPIDYILVLLAAQGQVSIWNACAALDRRLSLLESEGVERSEAGHLLGAVVAAHRLATGHPDEPRPESPDEALAQVMMLGWALGVHTATVPGGAAIAVNAEAAARAFAQLGNEASVEARTTWRPPALLYLKEWLDKHDTASNDRAAAELERIGLNKLPGRRQVEQWIGKMRRQGKLPRKRTKAD